MADDGAPSAGPLADLTAHIARQSPGVALQAEMQLFFRRTWSRLNAEQRLAGARTTLPDNAGPLNSQHLVHLALEAMRLASPAYFERFGAYVDALLWIESAVDARSAPSPSPSPVSSPSRTKSATRSRPDTPSSRKRPRARRA